MEHTPHNYSILYKNFLKKALYGKYESNSELGSSIEKILEYKGNDVYYLIQQYDNVGEDLLYRCIYTEHCESKPVVPEYDYTYDLENKIRDNIKSWVREYKINEINNG
jgi:hypothetical protein